MARAETNGPPAVEGLSARKQFCCQNHFVGLGSEPALAAYIRASVGVNSTRCAVVAAGEAFISEVSMPSRSPATSCRRARSSQIARAGSKRSE